MQSGPGGLANGKQVANVRFSPLIHSDPAAQIVGSWYHRNHLAGHIDAIR